MGWRNILKTGALALLAACTSGKPDGVAPAAAAPETVRSAVAAHGFAPADVGYVLRDLDSGRIVQAHNAGKAFIPASVAKLATGAFALEVLGGDHRFRTVVRAAGPIDDGVLQGDLVLIGGGDPLLGPDALLTLCRDLHRRGVRRVSGRFVYDESLYAARTAIRAAQPGDAQYNPGVSALSLDFNRLRVAWRPGNGSGGVAGYTVPPLPSIALEVGKQAPANGQRWRATVEDGLTTWRLPPGAPDRGAEWLPVKKPARMTAQIFRRLCTRLGVRLPAPSPGRASADMRTLAEYRGEPLAAVVRSMLRYSNNLVAELVGLAAGRALTGEALSLGESAAVMKRWWHGRLPEVDWAGFAPRNHSGLDAGGRATPAQLAAMLAFAADRSYADGQGNTRSLPDLLPAAGWGESLGGRLEQPATALAVWAKTGTMYFASGLAGYLYPGDGRRLAFTVFVNDTARRRAYDAAENPTDPAWRREIAGWRDRAKALEAALIASWSGACRRPSNNVERCEASPPMEDGATRVPGQAR